MSRLPVSRLRGLGHRVMRRLRRVTTGSPSADDRALVRVAYLALLQREPDRAGFATNLARLESGATWREVLGSLARSPEFDQLHSAMDEPYNSAMVRAVLRAVFWREPDDALVEHLARQLSEGVSAGKVFAELVHSGEFAVQSSPLRVRDRVPVSEQREELAIERRLAALEERVESLSRRADS